MDIERKKTIALRIFKSTYPNVTSADLQTFVLGMQAMENIFHDIEHQEDALNDYKLNCLENQSVEC